MPAIANVNWAPPFQGPFTVDRGISDYARKLTAYHRATIAFQAIISAPENQFTHMLKPGECVIFNNRRILHGRQQFESVGVVAGKERWLKGAYLDMDDVASTVRMVGTQKWMREEMKPQQEKEVEVEEEVHNNTQAATIPPVLTPEMEQVLEHWWQRRTQRAEQGLQGIQSEPISQEHPFEQRLLESQIPSEPEKPEQQVERSRDTLQEEQELHERHAAQRLQAYQ